jgi:hypothetical protein
MSQRHYLLSTSLLSSDRGELRQAAREGRATVVEVAEANAVVPLPWLACFRPGDLRPCTVDWAGEPMCIDVPCAGLADAADNLFSALPLFERLAPGQRQGREYWQRAISQLLTLQLPYVTLDVSQMLMNLDPGQFNTAVRAALARDDQALEAMGSAFFEYHAGVAPYSCSEFLQGQGLADVQRSANSLILEVGIRSPSIASFWEEKWRGALRRRSLMPG